MSSRVQKRAASESLFFLLIIGGILIVLNVLAASFPSPRIDLTHSRLFSLADGSKRLASSLEDRLEITAYFTADLPAPFNATERHVRDLLSEYTAVSDGDIAVTFVNPDDADKQQAAVADGVERVGHQTIEEDQVAVVEGYRGIVLKYLDKKKTLPVIEDTAGLEYLVTSAIKELVGERKTVGIVSEHASPMLDDGLVKLNALLGLYDLKEVDASQEIDPSLAAILIIDAQLPFTSEELRHVDQYVMRGGSLGIFGGVMAVDIASNAPSARPVNTGLAGLVGAWGIGVPQTMVLDAQSSRAPTTNPLGLQVIVPYPPIPVLQLTEEQSAHPVMFRLGAPMLAFVSPVVVGDVPEGATATVLANSSENSWAVGGPSIGLAPRDPREWRMTADLGPFALIVAIEGRLPSAYYADASEEAEDAIQVPPVSETDVRVLVSGTPSYLEDVFLPEPGSDQVQLNATRALALNSIDWLAADSDLIAIRAKTVEDPALAIPDSLLTAEDSLLEAADDRDKAGVDEALAERKVAIESWEVRKRAYRWANTLGIPILVVLFGVFRWRRRAAKKQTLKL